MQIATVTSDVNALTVLIMDGATFISQNVYPLTSTVAVVFAVDGGGQRAAFLNSNAQQIISFSGAGSGLPDEDNTFDGATSIAAIIAAIKAAYAATGGGGGGGGNVVVTSSVLPTGAATEVTLLAAATSLGLLDDVLQTVADTTIIPTRNLQVGGLDSQNGRSYAIPVSIGNAAQAINQRMVVVGGVRNRTTAAILPIIGAQNAEQVAIEGRIKALYRNTSVSSVKTLLSANGGYIYGYHIINPNAIPVYLKFYQEAFASVVIGTTIPIFVVQIPASGNVLVPADTRAQFQLTINMTIACLTGIQDSDTTGPGVGVFVQIIHSALDYL